MNRIRLLRVANLFLLCVIAIQIITGLIMFFAVDVHGVHLALVIHKYNALLLTALVTVHVALNWPWMRANYFRE